MTSPQIAATLADSRALAADQLAAAWQLQIERLQEQLNNGWPQQIARVLEERFTELSTRMQSEFETAVAAEVAARRAASEASIRRNLAEQLTLAARSVRRYENTADWAASVLDGAQSFCGRAVVFSVNGNSLRVEGARNVSGVAPLEDVALGAAHALAGAVESRDRIVAMRTEGELSAPLAVYLGIAPGEKCFVFPIGETALLYADGEVEQSPLELLATLARGTLLQSGNVTGSAWAGLSRTEQELHLRAQRFARVTVAEMRLYQSQAVKEGRTNSDLYTSLKEEIDRGRTAFRREFLSESPTMVDYLHLELLRTLAHDDAAQLGSTYAGPMV